LIGISTASASGNVNSLTVIYARITVIHAPVKPFFEAHRWLCGIGGQPASNAYAGAFL
jgi:hypothetical protein